MELATTMPRLPFGENTFLPRKGQTDLNEYLPSIKHGDCLTIQWPTGYGKSIGFAMTWGHCCRSGIANRFLLIVANITQLDQIINDFAGDCLLVGAPCTGGVWAFERSAGDLRVAMKGTPEIFVCTVQQLDASNRGGVNTLKDLLTIPGTRWMLGFDELHHYGEEMAWGEAAQAAMSHAAFTLAMSATPYRRGADIVFPEPRQVVTYADAVEQKSVKPMICHSYDYRVTVVDGSQQTASYTTSQLLREAPQGIDEWEERRNIRYSPEYIHPLILHPLTRLENKRLETGQRLQMLIRAMSCAHAEMVCQQVRTYAGEYLKVDWLGTGPHGRSEDDNNRVRRAFCPPKVNGRRPAPEIDILVQVSMAGEGFDSINVAEIVDIFPVSNRAASGRATSDKQFYGRGSRIIPDAQGIRLHVNVPSDHPLHAWAGMELHRWMDSSGREVQPLDEDRDQTMPEIDLFDISELPRKREIELLNITTEDPHFKAYRAGIESEFGKVDFNNPAHMDKAMALYMKCHRAVATQQSEQARKVQLSDHIELTVGRIGLVLAKQSSKLNGNGLDGKLIGRFKHDANRQLIHRFGKDRKSMLVDELEAVDAFCCNWLRKLKPSS